LPEKKGVFKRSKRRVYKNIKWKGEKQNMGESPRTIGITNFKGAIDLLLAGRKLRRKSWPDDGTFVMLIDEQLLIHKGPEKSLHSLTVSTGDILGEDWVVFNEPVGIGGTKSLQS
jgi:hypothetical protein